MMTRGKELYAQLQQESTDYKPSIQAHDHIRALTHEVFDCLNRALDHVMRIFFDDVIRPSLGEDRHNVGFPVYGSGGVDDHEAFVERLRRMGMEDIESSHPESYRVLLECQPFFSPKNHWLSDLREQCNRGKHVGLDTQTTFSLGSAKVICRRLDATDQMVPDDLNEAIDQTERLIRSFLSTF